VIPRDSTYYTQIARRFVPATIVDDMAIYDGMIRMIERTARTGLVYVYEKAANINLSAELRSLQI